MARTILGFVGDVFVKREHPAEVFRHVREVLRAPSILFANLEGAYTDRPHRVPGEVGGVYSPAQNIDVYAQVGFNVMSLANNHILDVGFEAMRESRSRLRAQGVQTCGAGENVADAHEPAILESDGLRIAFLAYASVFPIGWEARSESPGIATVRAYDVWRSPNARIHMPGLPPDIRTIPDESDLARLAQDIERARERADIVITSFHWGDHTRPFHLTDHETRTARYSIDHGAHMVIGHHHHALRGMEWYEGRPILYGLGHFVFDLRLGLTAEQLKSLLLELDPTGYWDKAPYTVAPREGWPYLPMHEDTRMTVLAWATAGKEGIHDVGFLPCRLTPDGAVEPLRSGSPESGAVVRYLEECNTSQGLKGRVVSEESTPLAGYKTLRVVPT